MKTTIDINFSKFYKNIDVAMSRVFRGTKKATTQACKEILEDSLTEVPRDTDTLASSGFYEVTGSYKNFEGRVGYGGNGDPENPKDGLRTSEYAVAVHEDLYAAHPIGKAKYLEDPVRRYAQKFPRAIMKEVDMAMSDLSDK